MGAFAGFTLSSVGALCMVAALLKERVFGRLTACTGLIGVLCLLVYIAGVRFVPGPTGWMAVALPGGLLMIAWYMMVARRLLQLGWAAEE
jgi:hypothetical protein